MVDFSDVVVGTKLVFAPKNGLRFRHRFGSAINVPAKTFHVVDIVTGSNTVKLVAWGHGENGGGDAGYGLGPLFVDLDELVLCEGVERAE